MMQRLQDKAPGVRAEAAAVLARLAQPDEVRILGRKDLAVTTSPTEISSSSCSLDSPASFASVPAQSCIVRCTSLMGLGVRV